MMGRTHALSGLCVGLALAPTVGLDDLAEVTLFAFCVAGFALLPDLDCENARASRVLGFITQGVSWLLRRASSYAFRLTKGPRDRGEGVHRHLSHTVVFALVLGGLTMLGAATVGKWFILGVVLFGIILAEDALGDWVAPAAGAVGLVLVATTDPLVALAEIGGWIGLAVAIGCVTHDLGDALTYSGCPLLWPIPFHGQSWFELGPPRFLRFETDGEFEHWFVFPAFVVLGFLLVPGVWDAILVAGSAISKAGVKT